MLRKFLPIIFSLAMINGIMAQGIDETLDLAHKLFELEQYESAVKLYRRVAFFGEDSLRASVYPRIAKCYLYNGNYQESIFFYTLSSNTASSDSLYNEYTFQRALCYILLNSPDNALQEVYSTFTDNSLYFIHKYHFYIGIISLMKNEIAQSQLHFLSASKSREHYNEIIEAYNNADLHRPNPRTARNLSFFLPGLGQLYSGDTFNAANSFLLNAGLAALMVRITIKQSFIDALLGIGPWFHRYYTGGFTRSEQIAGDRQAEKRNELLQELYSIFDYYYYSY